MTETQASMKVSHCYVRDGRNIQHPQTKWGTEINLVRKSEGRKPLAKPAFRDVTEIKRDITKCI